MGVYVHFTDEQKYRANNVDLADFLKRQGEKLIPSGRDKRLASDHSITVRGNQWYDHSAERGGYAIDFVRQYYDLTYPEAVTKLLGGEQGQVYDSADQEEPEPRKPFTLPDVSSDMRRVYAYLVKTRLLSRDVVSFFAKQELIYESCEKSRDKILEYHNAGFVGMDERARRSAETWTDATPPIASTMLEPTTASMCSRRPSICCRILPCTPRTGRSTAMWPSAGFPSMPC